jgi:2-dehydro-3-deoxyphosphogluconate aldolase/(4S)-4-hydroxy-2-oxoglutarate aldolase
MSTVRRPNSGKSRRSDPPAAVAGPAGDTTAQIIAAGLVAVLRAPSAKHFDAISDVLLDAGVRIIEVTLTATDALEAITRLSERFGAAALVGAGTVMTADQAEACFDAGAAFVVSPTASPDVIAAARIAGIAAYPGALTPTEIVTAYRAGAPAVKLFPASSVSPRFIKDLHGPCPQIPIMPSGGIGIEEVPAWIHAGAAAVGLGSPLIGRAAAEGPDAALAKRARRAVAAVTAARQDVAG